MSEDWDSRQDNSRARRKGLLFVPRSPRSASLRPPVEEARRRSGAREPEQEARGPDQEVRSSDREARRSDQETRSLHQEAMKSAELAEARTDPESGETNIRSPS